MGRGSGCESKRGEVTQGKQYMDAWSGSFNENWPFFKYKSEKRGERKVKKKEGYQRREETQGMGIMLPGRGWGR